MNDEELQRMNVLVATAAYSVARQTKFHGHVERDDIVSHLWEWVLKHPAKIERYRENNEDDGYERILASVLYDEANIFARKERAARMGYSTHDEFFFAKAGIEELLPSVFDRDAWVNPPTEHGNARSGKALNEGNNWLATLSDLSRAFSLLESKDQILLREVYAYETPRAELARREKLSRKGIDHRIDAAIRRLWREVGGPKWLTPEERDGARTGTVGARKAMSNAQAQAITRNQYDAG